MSSSKDNNLKFYASTYYICRSIFIITHKSLSRVYHLKKIHHSVQLLNKFTEISESFYVISEIATVWKMENFDTLSLSEMYKCPIESITSKTSFHQEVNGFVQERKTPFRICCTVFEIEFSQVLWRVSLTKIVALILKVLMKWISCIKNWHFWMHSTIKMYSNGSEDWPTLGYSLTAFIAT